MSQSFLNSKIQNIKKLLNNINDESVNLLSSKLNNLKSELNTSLISKKGINNKLKIKEKLITLKSNYEASNKKINSIIKLINEEPNKESKKNFNEKNKNDLLELISKIIDEIINIDMDKFSVTNQIKKLKLFRKILVFYTYLDNLNNKLKQKSIRQFFDKYLYIFLGNLDELIKSAILTKFNNINEANLKNMSNLVKNIEDSMSILNKNEGSISINNKLIQLKQNILQKSKNEKLKSFKLNFNTFKKNLNK
jgi:hypothetical protein